MEKLKNSVLERRIFLHSKVPQLRQSVKHPQNNQDFTSKIEERCNTALYLDGSKF